MMLLHSLVAVFPVSVTCTLIAIADVLLRTSIGCAGPASSSTRYVDGLKLTVQTTDGIIAHTQAYINATRLGYTHNVNSSMNMAFYDLTLKTTFVIQGTIVGQ